MKNKEIIKYLDSMFPLSSSEEWDNSGLQICSENQDINRILITLDITDKLVEYAINHKVDLVISHHPLIFEKLRNIDVGTYKGKMTKNIINSNINLYTIHTNYDTTFLGMTKEIGTILGISEIEILKKKNDSNFLGYGGIGYIQHDTNLQIFAQELKHRLNTEYMILYGDEFDKCINKIAFCGGSGSDYIIDAYEKGADVYITGDVKYHQSQLAYELDMPIIDAGHYTLEKFFISHLKELLENKFQDMKIFEYKINHFEGIII